MAKKQIVIDTGSSKSGGGEGANKAAPELAGDQLPFREEAENLASKAEDERTKLEDGKTKKPDAEVTPPDEKKPDEGTEVEPVELQIDDTTYKLDDKGNALNEDGSVFKTSEEIAALEQDEVTQVEIENVVYTVDADGNAVNDKGEVTYTAEQMADMEEDAPPAVDLAEIQKATNVVPLDASGQPKAYDNSSDSVVEYVNDAYDLGARTETKKAFDELFGKYPLLKPVLNHMTLNKGSLEGFNDTVNWEAMKLDKDNLDQLKSIVYAGRKARNEPDESIDSYWEYITNTDTNNDKALKEAKLEQEYLVKVTKAKDVERQQTIDAQNQATFEQEQKYWGYGIDEKGQITDLGVEDSVYSVIKNRTLKISDKETLKIPDKIKRVEGGKQVMRSPDDFFNYLTRPLVFTIDGKRVNLSQHDYEVYVEENSRRPVHDVHDALKRFVGYDDSQIIREKVNSERVKRIKKLTTRKSHKGIKKTKPENKTKKIIINT